MNENEEHGLGGGGLGGCGSGGGESIGMAQEALGDGTGGDGPIGAAQEALTGCCCDATQGEGKPGACHDVADPSQCSMGEVYTDGLCNAPPKSGTGICSISSAIGHAGHGMVGSVEGLGLFLTLVLCAGARRRMR